MLDYATQAADGSMYNTPPCWAIYIAGLVFAKNLRWVCGGWREVLGVWREGCGQGAAVGWV